MVEFLPRLFGHVWRRPIEVPVKRVDLMEGIPIVKGGRISIKTIDEIIKKELDLNGCL